MSPRRALRPRPRGPPPKPPNGPPNSPRGPWAKWWARCPPWREGPQRGASASLECALPNISTPIVNYLESITIYRYITFFKPPRREASDLQIQAATSSVAEVTTIGCDHRRTGTVHGGHDLLVAHRPARLDDRAHSGLHRELGTVGEGEVGVGGERRAGERLGLEGACLLDRDPHSVHPAHLPGADPDRGATGRHHDRVGAHVAADPPREQHVPPLPPRRLPPAPPRAPRPPPLPPFRLARAHHAHLLAGLRDRIPALHELAADHRLGLDLPGRLPPLGALGQAPVRS